MNPVQFNKNDYCKNLQNLNIKNGSYLGKTVKWLKKDHNAFHSVVKKIILIFVSALLLISVIGIPLFIGIVKEWKIQGKTRIRLAAINAGPINSPNLPANSGNLHKIENQRKTVIKIADGKQGLCNGPTRIDRVAEVFNKVVTHQPIGIKFNRDKMKGRVKGGNCSAMSFDFAYEYLKMKHRENITDKTSLETLINQIKKISMKYNLSRTFKDESTQEFMDRQEAFNCLEIDASFAKIDYSLEKVKALANFHDLKISSASEEASFKFTFQNTEIAQLEKNLGSLQNGVHLVRYILPKNNAKLEKYGHSMVLIKESQGTFFYDPNDGVLLINEDVPAEVYNILMTNFENFNLELFRFYKLETA